MQRAMPILGTGLTNPFASVNHISAGNNVGEIAYSVFNQSQDSKPMSGMALNPMNLLNTFVILFVFLIILIGNTVLRGLLNQLFACCCRQQKIWSCSRERCVSVT